jgi:hypothetical protein
MKVVINGCYGGFSLSPEATLRLWKLGCEGLEVTHVDAYWPKDKREEEDAKYPTMGYKASLAKWREYKKSKGKAKRESLFLHVFTPDEKYVLYARDVKRSDPNLLSVVEDMGEAANGACAELRIVDVPDGVDWEIEEYDGREWVAEKHRTWS